MGKIILYHGSPNEKVIPKFGLGDEKHDYGKGFYLTESLDLAKEWAVYRPNALNGWVHKNLVYLQRSMILSRAGEPMPHISTSRSLLSVMK